ncbi:MAG: hypothetical protein KKF77_09385 [Proteobacteria bacterium]|nr:hypothetical protein [Pseudomonadota bacterium]
MKKFNEKDRVFSRRHRSGEICVDVAGSKVLLGRVIKKDGTPGREVIVSIADVTHRWPFLPGVM